MQNQAHGWMMDELGFYVPSTVFQSFRDDNQAQNHVRHELTYAAARQKPTK